MARMPDMRATEIHRYLWDALDAVAIERNIPTGRLMHNWLHEMAHRHADDPDLSVELRTRLAQLVNPYGRHMAKRDYPRRAGEKGA